jgi:hypothetical protein
LTANRSHRVIAGGLLVAGGAFHAYEQLFLSTDADAWFYLWSVLPYLVCLIVLIFSANAIPAIAAALLALGIDAFAHHEVFINPTSSTAALALVFAPLWSTIIVVPLTILIARFVISRRVAREP